MWLTPCPPCHISPHHLRSIPVAVLSVCSTQYKTVLDALRGRKERFLFEEVEISLKPTVMAFITMNPGYPGAAPRGGGTHLRVLDRRPRAAVGSWRLGPSRRAAVLSPCATVCQRWAHPGHLSRPPLPTPPAAHRAGRAELPESLKALFRPVSMVLPDLGLICEIMLMAEGFQSSKLLSRKFVILYKLCEVGAGARGGAEAGGLAGGGGAAARGLTLDDPPARSLHAASTLCPCLLPLGPAPRRTCCPRASTTTGSFARSRRRCMWRAA